MMATSGWTWQGEQQLQTVRARRRLHPLSALDRVAFSCGVDASLPMPEGSANSPRRPRHYTGATCRRSDGRQQHTECVVRGVVPVVDGHRVAVRSEPFDITTTRAVMSTTVVLAQSDDFAPRAIS